MKAEIVGYTWKDKAVGALYYNKDKHSWGETFEEWIEPWLYAGRKIHFTATSGVAQELREFGVLDELANPVYAKHKIMTGGITNTGTKLNKKP